MRPFHLLVRGRKESEPRRIDFRAESPDHAFVVARNETDGSHVELWDGGTLLARMTKSDANVWKLHPVTHAAREVGGQDSAVSSS